MGSPSELKAKIKGKTVASQTNFIPKADSNPPYYANPDSNLYDTPTLTPPLNVHPANRPFGSLRDSINPANHRPAYSGQYQSPSFHMSGYAHRPLAQYRTGRYRSGGGWSSGYGQPTQPPRWLPDRHESPYQKSSDYGSYDYDSPLYGKQSSDRPQSMSRDSQDKTNQSKSFFEFSSGNTRVV